MLSVILSYWLVLAQRGLMSYSPQNRLIDFGYVTTRVVVEPQDLGGVQAC